MRLLDDARICLMIFTRLPVSWPEDLPKARIIRALQAAPIIGLTSGVLAAVVYAVAFWGFNGSVHICATLAVLSQVLTLRAYSDKFVSGQDAMPEDAAPAFGSPILFLAILLKVFLVAEIAVVWQAGLALIISGVLAQIAFVQILAWSKTSPDNSPSDGGAHPTAIEASTASVFGAVVAGIASVAAFQLSFLPPSLGAVVGAALGGGAMALATRKLREASPAQGLSACVFAAELGALLGLVALLPNVGF
ncbi:MAG: hypothetical protein RL186_1508 [Pseudomonadota bacterium]